MQYLRPMVFGLLMLATCAGTIVAQAPVGTSERAQKPAAAVPPIPPAPSGGTEEGGTDKDLLPWLPGDAIWLEADGGRLVPVPFDAKLKDFLEWLKVRNQPPTDQPEFSIASISFEGTADDERATLTAKFQIQIQRDNVWVRVPLRMDEAFPRPGSTHGGAGEGVPAGGVERDTVFEPGIAWHLKGRGLHELTIPLVVPVRKQPARRLELTLPKSTASSLKLRIPSPHVRVTPLEHSLLKPRPTGDGATEVEVVGLGERIDLRWLPQTDVEASLLAATSIRLSLTRDGESVLLKANQKIRARQGSFQRVKVQLPPGFDLQNAVELQNGQPKLGSRPYGREDMDATHAVTVELEEPTEGPVEIQWELEAPFPTNGQLSLSGFQVERARLQQGEIAISSTDGYLVKQLGGESIRRINIGDLSVSLPVDSAYRFNQQPYRLDLRIEAIEPQFTGEPVFLLHTSTDGVELIADLRYSVIGGAVPEVELKWPGWRAEGWKIIDPPRTAAGAVDVRYEGESGNESWHIRVVDPSQREFRQTFRAKREFAPDKSPVTLTLPRVVAPIRREPVLVVVDEENVESKIEPTGGTELRTLPPGRRQVVELPENLRPLNRTEYQIDSQGVAKFSTGITVHQRQVRAKSEVETELRQNRLYVNQRILYDVKFEPIGEIGLLAPKSLERRIVFAMVNGETEIPLTPIWTPHEKATSEKARFNLREPRKGEFTVIARYEIPVPEELPRVRDASLVLPLIQSADAQIAPVVLKVRNSTVAEVSVSDAAWSPQMSRTEEPLSDVSGTVWMTLGESATVPLRLSPLRRDSFQEFAVQKSYVRTIQHPDGNVSVRGQYRIEGAVSSLEMGIPVGCMDIHYWWDQRPLEFTEQAATDSSLRGHRLQISREVERGSHLLTVEYSLPFEGLLSWSVRRELLAPRFTSNVWTEQSIWEVVLPLDRYLWAYPDGFSPQFQWQRQSFFWARTPLEPYNDPAGWIGGAEGPADIAGSFEGNSYVFSRSAPASTLSMVSLHQSMVLLFGAGFALAAGFVLLKVPATRTVLTPLVLAFVAAILWLLAAAPVQLLLQPALLGLLLAVVAAIIDGAFHRDQASVLLTVAPASELAPSHDSGPSAPLSGSTASRPVIIGAGSDDPTALRPSSDELAESPSSYESGTSR